MGLTKADRGVDGDGTEMRDTLIALTSSVKGSGGEDDKGFMVMQLGLVLCHTTGRRET